MERAEHWFENFIRDIHRSHIYETGPQPGLTATLQQALHRQARGNVRRTLAKWPAAMLPLATAESDPEETSDALSRLRQGAQHARPVAGGGDPDRAI